MNHQLTAADMAAIAKAENAAARKTWGNVSWNNTGPCKQRTNPPSRRSSPVAVSIMQAIADGHRTRGSIAEAIGREPTKVGHRLKDLCRSGLVTWEGPSWRKTYALTGDGREWLGAKG